MFDRETHVGVVSEPRTVDVEKGFLQFFAKATGETDPVYFDEDAASAAGHRAIPAPPIYLFSLFLAAPAKRGGLFHKTNGLGVDTSRILHGEQSFTYQKPVYAGNTLTLTTTTSDIYVKKAARSNSSSRIRMRWTRQASCASRCALSRWCEMVEGQQLPELVRGPTTRGTLALFAGAMIMSCSTSTATFARAAGMDDVFVHGMLSMAYLAQALRTWAPQERIRHWNVRLNAITPLHAVITCRGEVSQVFENDGERRARLTIGAWTDQGIQTLSGEVIIAID